MPELLTKYPDAALTVAKSAGGKCGVGEPQKILTKCPKERFCSFSGGELCIYGLSDVGQMTQISAQELSALVCKPEKKDSPHGDLPSPIMGAAGLALLVGIVFGTAAGRRRRS